MKFLRGFLPIFVVSVILVSTVYRIVNQIVVLMSEILRLEAENKSLLRKIEEASSSASREARIRNDLGMGKEDDYWVIMPKDITFDDLYPKYNLGDVKPNWLEWVELFTR
ncbi:MAG: hypothetical protein UT14_C0009G0011 [Candidatus Shapirobacteria bacterium GW2011_GWE1_38_92]|uniref:Septum formation initiator n=1 Tax=Candidatus Shapirobacteria bacterium GW2011_GWE1_38_92 TaxID=1618489 RepID=A0A0G0LUG8_9BACT|nr:MAG: hypothetical protein UT14_C0009G0011 [Candidatus Shapirobacteria bacterium GW2011_GWE1_38_92]